MSLDTRYFLYYDLALMVLGFIIVYVAYWKGFARQLGDVLTLIATMVISILASPFLASEIPLMTASSEIEIIKLLQNSALQIVNTFLWFLILFWARELRLLRPKSWDAALSALSGKKNMSHWHSNAWNWLMTSLKSRVLKTVSSKYATAEALN